MPIRIRKAGNTSRMRERFIEKTIRPACLHFKVYAYVHACEALQSVSANLSLEEPRQSFTLCYISPLILLPNLNFSSECAKRTVCSFQADGTVG